MLPTTNVLQRVFRISYDGKEGTCFTIDVDDRQYLITAKHIAEAIQKPCEVAIYHNGQWKHLPADLVGHGANEVDLTVLAAKQQISPTYLLEPTIKDMVLGQEMLFLGFPYGMANEAGNINNGFPIPLVKKGILSAMNWGSTKDLLLDGHNNPGFSGGPVVYQGIHDPMDVTKVAGLVSGYIGVPETVYDGSQDTGLTYNYNTGIVRVISITHALDLIKAHPTGFALCR